MIKELEPQSLTEKYTPFSKEHSQDKVQWALSHFIDQDNGLADYGNFANIISETLIGVPYNASTGNQRALHEVLQKLTHDVENARRFNNTYIGHMLSEACIPGMWGQMIATRIGSNTVAREVSLKESGLEKEAIHFLMDVVGYNKDKASGTFTTGGSMAVMTALAIARKKYQKEYEEKYKPVNKSPEAKELSDIWKLQNQKTLYVLATHMAHYSFKKHMTLLAGPYGETDLKIQQVGMTNLKMDVDDLKKQIEIIKRKDGVVMAIYAIAGETETGLIDPLDEIIDVARDCGTFAIADGAYGAMYRLSRLEKQFNALSKYDAIILDPHKTLYTPYPSGAVLFKSAEDHALLAAGIDAPYLNFAKTNRGVVKGLLYEGKNKNRFNLGQKRIEGSGTAGSILSTVAVSRSLSTEGIGIVLDITLDRIKHLHQRLLNSKYLEPVHNSELNLVCFRIKEGAERKLGLTQENPKTRQKSRETLIRQLRVELDKGIKGDGGYYFSDTALPLGKEESETSVFRACIMNPRTTDKILDDAVTALEGLIEKRISN
ncbi:MAG TPA: pyridoxal-dependent decarboxylase [Candidatus Saccharimonadales bacterium]|jgi:glutamate decarboxylase|nr:pyridoxal-dependent decarboxylase [Candidatus Saccharimonadales bacterium]